jgi:hypothetical protein
MVRSMPQRRRPNRSLDSIPFAGDAYFDPLPPQPSAQVGTVVGFVRVQALGLEVSAAVGVVSRLVTFDHGLQAFAVVGVACRDTDEKGQSVRVRQDAHLGTRLAPVHGAWTCVFAPSFFSPAVGGVEDDSGDVDEAGVVEAVQHGLVEVAPDAGSRPDQEPAVNGRLRYAEACGSWRQAQPLTRT